MNDQSFIQYILLSILKCEKYGETNAKAVSILEYQQSIVCFMNAFISQNCIGIIGEILRLRLERKSVIFVLADILQIQSQNKAVADEEAGVLRELLVCERSLMINTVLLLLKNMILLMSSKERAGIAPVFDFGFVLLLKCLQDNDGYEIAGDIQKIMGPLDIDMDI